MYIDSVPNRSSPPAVLLRESYRDSGRVKKRTLANLSKLPTDAIQVLRRVLRGERLVNPEDAFTCVRSLPHGHIAAVLSTLKQLGLHTLIDRNASRVRDLVLALIVARVIDAQSKLATARALAPESAVSTLGEVLGLGAVDQHELYAAMDWLVQQQAAIEQRLAKRHLQENTLVLYDLTSSYLEGTHCPLAQLGYSRDGKPGTLQIVFGLLCTAVGCPLAVEVFEGSTSDPKTVACQVEKIRTRFGLQRVVLVGDRGMLTAARIREDLAGVDGLRWITTLRAPMIRKLLATGTVTPSLFDERDLAEVTSEAFPGELELTRYGGDITLWGEESTMPKTRAAYPLEFRGQMIELVRAGRSPEALGREFEPSAQAIRNWVRQADRDAGRRADGLTTAERTEMQRLRRENATLREEREILKKAAAWFARETGAVPSRSSRSSERTGRSMP